LPVEFPRIKGGGEGGKKKKNKQTIGMNPSKRKKKTKKEGEKVAFGKGKKEEKGRTRLVGGRDGAAKKKKEKKKGEKSPHQSHWGGRRVIPQGLMESPIKTFPKKTGGVAVPVRTNGKITWGCHTRGGGSLCCFPYREGWETSRSKKEGGGGSSGFVRLCRLGGPPKGGAWQQQTQVRPGEEKGGEKGKARRGYKTA